MTIELLCAGLMAGLLAAMPSGEQPKRQYPRFWPGTRWHVAFGSYKGVERFAVDELQRTVQLPFPYVVAIEDAKRLRPAEQEHLILVGTPEDNPLIHDLIEKGKLKPPTGPEGYSIACFDSPWKKGQRVIALAGHDPAGVLYGVEDFNARVVRKSLTREQFDGIKDFAFREAPAVRNRGIWTWGYVIYDYRRFLDHMARLKMNTLIVWSDVPPRNCREVIEYAHSHGVRVILGFHWGWGIEGLDPNSAKQRKAIKAEVVDEFRRSYRGLGMDGIYFQTFTEHSNLLMGGKSTAAIACEWVNDIAAGIFKLAPHIRIEFGLHATSIRKRYVDLAPLDPRITITWEDAGSLPYTYDPVTPTKADFDATVAFSKKLATFRSNREFSMVAKGWIQLPWETSEHHGEYVLGERDKGFITERLAQRHGRWDTVNELWRTNYPLAARFYREMLRVSGLGDRVSGDGNGKSEIGNRGPERGNRHPELVEGWPTDPIPDTRNPMPFLSVTGLVEDGMIEEKIQPSVALFAQTLWDPFDSDAELLERANSPYYTR